jgi:hypothetical protein
MIRLLEIAGNDNNKRETGINFNLTKINTFLKCATHGGRLVCLCARAGSAVSNAEHELSYSEPSIVLPTHIAFLLTD